MAVVHKNLPDSELHEPKGVSSAAADQVYVTDGDGSGTFRPYDPGFTPFSTADADQVYVSDGGGGGVLLPYDKEPKDIDDASADQVYVADGSGSGSWEDYYTPTSPAYASMLAQNDSTLSLSAASDSDLKTNSDYVPLNTTDMWEVEVASGVSASASSGQFTVSSEGDYHILICASLKSDVKTRVGIIFGDGSDYYTKRSIVDIDTKGTTITANTVVPSISSATDVAAYIAAEDDADITVNTITFTVQRLSQ